MNASADQTSAVVVQPATAAPDLVHRFYEIAKLRGPETAVESAEGVITYSELDRLSNQLANRLTAAGVRRDSSVAISVPRGARELVALLAASKAGGAYVPLDPTHPVERLMGIVEDAQPRVTIVGPESPLMSILGGTAGTIVADDLARLTETWSSDPPAVEYDPEQIAYVLYTSGSTGRPKGVEVIRGAFANFLQSMAHTPGLSRDDRVLAITTTCFDIAGLELFLPLWVGATTVIADSETAADSRRLRRRIEQGDISLMQATPATWRLLLEAGWRGSSRLRMLCGGEALSPALADRLLSGGGELWNMYGPTETTVWSTLQRLTPGYDRITIGRPIDETQVYVLDEALSPVPDGQEGEIWIGGRGLARGYRGRPDLTAERFVQNPNGPPGDRIYRTGDLGRRLPDGRFECLGRLDHQVKIRGFRVELGEIESVLRSVPGVAEALVVADPGSGGEPRLVAYWVGDADRPALIARAQRKLPAYMVPSAYVPIPAFPLNTNGKIDRKRLPPPDTFEQDGASIRRARTDTETRIAAIWGEILGMSQVPVDESFFTIGGTSATAIQVIARIERDTGVELPLQAFFKAPTIEGLASQIGASLSPDEPVVVWLRRGGQGREPLFCLLGVHLYQDLALAMSDDRPVVGMHVPFRHLPGQRPPTLERIADRYVELVRSIQPAGPYHLLGLCFGGVVAYEVARKLERSGHEVALVAILDAVLPSAARVDRAKRALAYAGRVLQRGALKSWMRRKFRELGNAWPALGRVEGLVRERSRTGRQIDLELDGHEADLLVREFASRPSELGGDLLVVTASQASSPAWIRIDDDHGWRGRAREVTIVHVEAGHLDIVREPHVREIAAAVAGMAPCKSGGVSPAISRGTFHPASSS